MAEVPPMSIPSVRACDGPRAGALAGAAVCGGAVWSLSGWDGSCVMAGCAGGVAEGTLRGLVEPR